jgi:dihydroorotate dehydrogenase
MYKILIRKILFLFPPEVVHQLVVGLLKFPLFSKILRLIYSYEHPSLQRTVLGITFKNPLGLAAGFDKDAELVDELTDLGFGFIEIGTVTPLVQPGNPRPRLFRLPQDEALINRMGFNNQGVEAVAARLKKRKKNVLIGGNIGKNKATPNETAVRDYEICFEKLYDLVDFFIVNVSSPNTPNLRELQEKEPLKKLLSHLHQLSEAKPLAKPIFLKIAPDLTDQQLDEIVEIVKETHTAGIVATNTTIGRENLWTPAEQVARIGEGGLSGKPLRERSTQMISYLRNKLGPDFPLIGSGGIHSPQDALEKLNAGATLIEIYTGFIYEGPALIKRINKCLVLSGKNF